MINITEIENNINQLKTQLKNINQLIKHDVVSIMIDGSVIRGDFIDTASDIDLTITTASDKVNSATKQLLAKAIKSAEAKLPKRVFPNKPLVYDVQWQSLAVVKETGTRKLVDWNANNIPRGYPKLWLYSFDSIKHHRVIYGQDITKLYTTINPKLFAPIRLQRIKQSAEKIKGNISPYEAQNGAITQIKNAWEAVRCKCLVNDLNSIKKEDVYNYSRVIFSETDFKYVTKLYSFYVNNNKDIFTGNFREKLYKFTINICNE